MSSTVNSSFKLFFPLSLKLRNTSFITHYPVGRWGLRNLHSYLCVAISYQDSFEERGEEDEVEFEEGIGEPDEPLDEARKKNFQTQAARANYVCMDRADLGYAVKECMRKLSNPGVNDVRIHTCLCLVRA